MIWCGSATATCNVYKTFLCPGIDPVAQKRLFQEFERLDQKRAQGYGLGLSVVRRIMERLGGEVGVESAVGVGSLFFFTLPVADLVDEG